MKYEDVWKLKQAGEELDNHCSSLYELHIFEGGDASDDLSEKDENLIRAYRKGFDLSFNKEEEATTDDIAQARREEALSETEEDAGEDEPDTCVRILLHVPAAHLSAAQREKLTRDMVKEAAVYSKMWMDTLALGGEEIIMSEEEDFAENNPVESELDETEETTPEEVMTDIVQKWRETYESMRPDYKDDYDALDAAVFECLIEDGYIAPGQHYNKEKKQS